jgi:hypothetical protein
MLTFLFWNLAKRDIGHIVSALVLENKVDILLLAESTLAPANLLRMLNPTGSVRFNFVPPPRQTDTKIDIFFGFHQNFIQPKEDIRRATIRVVKLPGRTEFLLCGVHFQSALVWNDESQALESARLNTTIRETEKREGHTRTLVVGDLNMNPFALGVTSASGFNAVMTREVALRGTRRLSDEDHPFFFNPMWGHFGDGESGPAGTFYHNPNEYASIYWHMLDQVLVRPELVPYFELPSLKILTDYSAGPLIGQNGRPSASDHLPIIFKLNV